MKTGETLRRLLFLLQRRKFDADLDEEMRLHLELRARVYRQRGIEPGDAAYAARRAFGNSAVLKETSRDLWGWNWFEDLLQDVRYAGRLLASKPGFAIVAVLTLALGIGANTAIFSVMNGVMLQLLPVAGADRLVHLYGANRPNGSSQTGYDDSSFPHRIFELFRAERGAFSDLVAFVPLGINKVAVRHGSEPEEAQVDMVSGDFFTGLGVRAAWGRTLTLEEEKNHAQVAVLSYSWWTTRFARNPSILGQTLHIKGLPFAIVGVAAPDFAGLERGKRTDVWVPLQNRPELKPWGTSDQSTFSLYGSPDWWCLMMVGRLAPGVSAQQVTAQLSPLFVRAAREGLGTQDPKAQPPQLSLVPARGIQGLRDQYRQPLTVLMAMVGLVLLIACGNVAMLLAARNAARRREFSLRIALGGSRARLFRQLLTESLLLVAAGGLLGWVFAISATRALAAWSQLELSLAPDRTVLLFTLAVSVGAALLFGLAPLRGVVRIPIGAALKTSPSTANRDVRRVRSGQLVVALQVSLCLVLLVGAGLLVRTLRNLQTAGLGLRTSGLLVFGVSPQRYMHSDAEAVRFYQTLLNRLRALPGVEAATLMQNRIGSGWSNNSNTFVDGVDPSGASKSMMRWNTVGPDYFHVLGTPLLLGRDFTEADSPSAPKVVIINQTFAERYLPGRAPLGHRVALEAKPGSNQYTIIGVAADSKYTSVREKPVPMAYFPYTQVAGVPSMHVELRTSGSPAAMLPVVRRAVGELAPDLPLLQPTTQQEQFESSFSQEQLIARLSMFFGLLAAVLVATGLYGTLAYKVSRRTAELGVRMALGAQRGQVLWMVLRESLNISLIGIALGIPVAIASAHLLRSMLFGLAPGDPLTFAAALLGITAVALAASLIPARRAASVDPLVALRYE